MEFTHEKSISEIQAVCGVLKSEKKIEGRLFLSMPSGVTLPLSA